MASSIALVSGDQRLRLGDNELLWRFGFGSDWQMIRVGMLYSVNMGATLPTTDLKIGINSGTQFGFRSSSCVEYIGAQWGNGSGTAFTFAAGSPNTFNYGWYRMHYKVGASDTVTSSNSQTFYGSADPSVRSFAYVDFIKRVANGTQITLANSAVTSSGNVTDTSLGLFYRYMEYDMIPPSIWSAAVVALNYAGPYSFDSLSVTWSDDVNTLEITELLVVRFA